MFDSIVLKKLLVIDVETVPVAAELKSLSESMQELWEAKAGKNRPEDVTKQDYFFNNAGLFAEFGKIVCISVGYFLAGDDDDKLRFRMKSFSDREEKPILEKIIRFLNRGSHTLAGHNIKGFDAPWIARRILINGFTLPKALDNADKKPWEVKMLDTMELWNLGAMPRHTVSLALLSSVLGLPSPKGDMDGSEVGSVFWHEDGIDRITQYCQKDVLAVAQLLLRFKGMPELAADDVDIAPNPAA